MLGLSFVNEMENMQREMEQLFRGFGFNPTYEPQQQQNEFKISDTDKSFVVEALLPGLNIDKLDIAVLGRNLTITGEFAAPELPEGAHYHRQERSTGPFSQNLHLSADLDNEKIVAEYKQGILHIELPKAASARPKQITINPS